MSTSKDIRRKVCQWLSNEGFSFNKRRHKMLKDILMGKAPEEELYEDNDPNLLHEAE
jgi:hypothetical protein